MRHGRRVIALLSAWLLATGAAATDDAAPDPEFLEFLGSWSGEDAGDDWLDVLQTDDPGLPQEPGAVPPADDHEAP